VYLTLIICRFCKFAQEVDRLTMLSSAVVLGNCPSGICRQQMHLCPLGDGVTINSHRHCVSVMTLYSHVSIDPIVAYLGIASYIGK